MHSYNKPTCLPILSLICIPLHFASLHQFLYFHLQSVWLTLAWHYESESVSLCYAETSVCVVCVCMCVCVCVCVYVCVYT